MVRLARARERPGEAEALERRLGHALHAGRVGRLAQRVRIVGEPADLDGMLRGSVAGDPDQMKLQHPAQLIQARGDDRLLADAVVRPGRLEEPELATMRDERRVDAAAGWRSTARK